MYRVRDKNGGVPARNYGETAPMKGRAVPLIMPRTAANPVGASVPCQVEREGTPYIILANIFLPVIPEHPGVPDTPETRLGPRLITAVYDR